MGITPEEFEKNRQKGGFRISVSKVGKFADVYPENRKTPPLEVPALDPAEIERPTPLEEMAERLADAMAPGYEVPPLTDPEDFGSGGLGVTYDDRKVADVNVFVTAEEYQSIIEARKAKTGWYDTPPAPSILTVPQMLEGGAAIYRERNVLYGDNYKHFGETMIGLFPNGLTCKTVDDFNRLGVFVQIVSKVSRYANVFDRGGHDDSLADLAVYATMLRELDK